MSFSTIHSNTDQIKLSNKILPDTCRINYNSLNDIVVDINLNKLHTIYLNPFIDNDTNQTIELGENLIFSYINNIAVEIYDIYYRWYRAEYATQIKHVYNYISSPRYQLLKTNLNDLSNRLSTIKSTPSVEKIKEFIERAWETERDLKKSYSKEIQDDLSLCNIGHNIDTIECHIVDFKENTPQKKEPSISEMDGAIHRQIDELSIDHKEIQNAVKSAKNKQRLEKEKNDSCQLFQCTIV